MKIQNLKTKVIGPVLLLLPMACMHLGDGHHSGDHHSLTHQPPYQFSVYNQAPEGVLGHEGMTIHQDSDNEK
jgi:hypothetical protein